MNDAPRKEDWWSSQVAHALAVRWSPVIWPVLNLGVLVELILQEGDSAYESIISKGFARFTYNQQSFVKDFCDLAEICAKSDRRFSNALLSFASSFVSSS